MTPTNQYWHYYRLVANLGHNAPNRKLTRKAIESVNVPRACNTIERPPGAPIALRLQGNLLYGVAGVYKKHGVYLLDDVEKMWARMRTFCRDMQNSASNKVDLNAGKAKWEIKFVTQKCDQVCSANIQFPGAINLSSMTTRISFQNRSCLLSTSTRTATWYSPASSSPREATFILSFPLLTPTMSLLWMHLSLTWISDTHPAREVWLLHHPLTERIRFATTTI